MQKPFVGVRLPRATSAYLISMKTKILDQIKANAWLSAP